jgi:hypothetical protein
MVFTTTCFDSHESSSGYVQNLTMTNTLIKHNGMDTLKIKIMEYSKTVYRTRILYTFLLCFAQCFVYPSFNLLFTKKYGIIPVLKAATKYTIAVDLHRFR